MPPPVQFTDLLRLLAKLFAAECRDGGRQAVRAIDSVLDRPFDEIHSNSQTSTDICSEALGIHPHPDAHVVLAAIRYINWYHFGLKDGRIRPEIAQEMLTAELIGPNGLVSHPDVRIGLFVQAPHVEYVTRIHAAEETFVMLGGTGFWAKNGGKPVKRRAGDTIHHPSNMPHSTFTKSEPLIAAWRWSGKISIEEYFLTG